MGNIDTSIAKLVGIYKDVANAIRAKLGTSTTLTPEVFAQQILNIPSGGGDAEEWVKHSVNLLEQVSVTKEYPIASFQNNKWYFYDAEQDIFIQKDPTTPIINITALGNNIYLKIIEQDDCDKILLAINDRSVLVNAYLNEEPLEIIDSSMVNIRLKTVEKLASLDNLVLKLDFFSFNTDSIYDDLLIANSDDANLYPTSILSRGALMNYSELSKDPDTNYVLDKIIGIDDPQEYNRTFTALDPCSYDNISTATWGYKEKAYKYSLYFKANNNDEIYLGEIENGADPEEIFTYNILDNEYFNLSEYTTDDNLQLNIQCNGERFFDGNNYLQILGPISDINNNLRFNSDYTEVSYDLISGASAKFHICNAAGETVEQLEPMATTLPVEVFGDADSIKLLNVEHNKITNTTIGMGNALKLCAFTYQISNEDCEQSFTLGADNWYTSNAFDGINAPVTGFAYAKLSFTSRKATKVKLCLQQYTSSYSSNFTIVSTLNNYLEKSTTNDSSNVLARLNNMSSYSNVSYPGQFYTAWIDIPAGESFITLKYRKTTDSTSNGNKLKFKIEEERDYWYISSDECLTTNYTQIQRKTSFIYNNKIYTQSDSYYGGNSLYIYDLDTGIKTTKTINSYSYASGLLGDNSGRFYAFEYDGGNCRLKIYDIETATVLKSFNYSQVHAYSSASWAQGLAACSIGSKIYFVNPNSSENIQIFDIDTQQKSYKSAPLCYYKKLVPVNNKIYIIGTGLNQNINEYRNFIGVYDVATNSYYYENAGMPWSMYMYYAGCCSINNRYIVLLGSSENANNYENKIYIYDTVLKETHASRNKLPGRYPANGTTYQIYYRYEMSLLSDGNILYGIGGYISSGYTGGWMPSIFKTVLCNSRDLLPE